MFDKLFSKMDANQLFWDWFSKNSEKLYSFEQNQDFLFHRLKDELNKIDPNLVFEFSPVLDNGKREFVISADGIKSSFDSVKDLTKNAPKLLRWDIVAFRLPKPITDTFYFEYIEVAFDDIYFSSTNNNGKLDLDLYIKDFSESAELTSLKLFYFWIIFLVNMTPSYTLVGWRSIHTKDKKI